MTNITAVVICGGLGTRLRSRVSEKPKVLAPVQGRPFLSFLLDQISSFGIEDVVLCAGYMGDQVQAEFGDSYGDISLVYSQETALLGTGGALRLAGPLIQSDMALVMNGDSFCDVDMEDLKAWHHEHNADLSMVLVRVPDVREFGSVEVSDIGRVVKFAEKQEGMDVEVKGWINAGIYLLKRSLLQTIRENAPVSLERDVFPYWLGLGFYGFKSDARFLDIGTPQSYLKAEKLFPAP